jgi:hypothetical protein
MTPVGVPQWSHSLAQRAGEKRIEAWIILCMAARRLGKINAVTGHKQTYQPIF